MCERESVERKVKRESVCGRDAPEVRERRVLGKRERVRAFL